MSIRRVCVYCASSPLIAREYLDAAYETGALLARAGVSVVYGGGGSGSMGKLAEGALANQGTVIGVMPRFMRELEWAHNGLSELQIVEDMRERKHRMLTDSDAVIALPGGCGTLEELMEAITLKRLAIYFNPIVFVNTRGFYAPLLEQMERCIQDSFMDARHRDMWQVVEHPEEILSTIASAPRWSQDARNFATLPNSK